MIAMQPQQKTMPRYSYEETLVASQKANWRIDDIIGGDKRLDFGRPFMPETFARMGELEFLSANDRLRLNQIRGFDYLCAFGLVEEFILPFVLDHARPMLHGDDYRVRAFLGFAAEEAKHIHLFKRFRAEFEAGFGTECLFIGPAEEIAAHILGHDPLSVALAILQIEWMSQRHYLDSIRDAKELDPQFASLLRHHWMEEAQHAKLDTMMVETLAEGRTEAELEKALDGYLEIGGFLDGGLRQQVDFNMENLQRSTGRTFTATEREEYVRTQHQAMRWTFLGSGMTHPNFLGTLERLSPSLRRRIEEVAPMFC